MYREIGHGDEVRSRIKKGIDTVADTVKITLGARGRNVILDTNEYEAPTNTNDGVTIVREMVLRDRFENIGAKLIKEVAAKTNDVAGDGTTTACVLMQAIVHEGTKAIANGADPVIIRRGIEKAAAEIIKAVKKEARKADTLELLISTATISCGDPVLGELVANAVQKAGIDGMVTLEDNKLPETVSESLEGLKLRGGFTLQHFVNVPELQQASFKDVAVVVTNYNVTTAQEMVAIAKSVTAKYGKTAKEVVVIANSIEGDALMTALQNWVEQRFFVLPLRVMAYGDLGEGMLKDVAKLTGATYIDSALNKPLTSIIPDDIGFADKIVATKHETIVVAGTEKAKEERIVELKAMLETARDFEAESLRERIAKLRSAMFTIKVGGTTDTERKERKLRVEDAINATRAAQVDGVVAGGGSALYRAALAVGDVFDLSSDEAYGRNAVVKACSVPIDQMAKNASIQLDRSDYKGITSSKKAIDFTNGVVVDAFSNGIIDPVKVVISSLENAASGAALFLTTDAAVVLQEEPEAEQI